MKQKVYLVCIVLALAAWLIASWPTLQVLNQKWTDVGDSYVLGYPLLIAAGWLIYLRRRQLLAITLKPSWCGVLLFVASMLLVYAARLIQLQIVQQIMLPVSLGCAIFALAGWPLARALSLPIALQYFGMPVWDFLIGILQNLTIAVAQVALSGMQIPIWLRGDHIHLPDGVITVAGSCSGLNLFLAALVTATLQAELGRYNAYRRGVLLFAAGVIGLLDNWVRVVALILIAHYSRMQNPLIYSHAAFGWWIYAASLVPFFWIARRLELPASAPAADFRVASEVTRLPLRHSLALLAAIIAGEYGTAALSARSGAVEQMQVAGAARVIEPEFMPHYSGYDRQQSWELTDSSGRYELSAFIYTHEYGNKKLIYYDNFIADEAQLKATGTAKVGARVINFAVLNGEPPRVVWWYYWIDGAIVNSPLRAKLYQLKAVLLGDPSVALIVLSQRCADDCQSNLQRAQDPANQTAFVQMLSLKGASRQLSD